MPACNGGAPSGGSATSVRRNASPALRRFPDSPLGPDLFRNLLMQRPRNCAPLWGTSSRFAAKSTHLPSLPIDLLAVLAYATDSRRKTVARKKSSVAPRFEMYSG